LESFPERIDSKLCLAFAFWQNAASENQKAVGRRFSVDIFSAVAVESQLGAVSIRCNPKNAIEASNWRNWRRLPQIEREG
jgi:hypothetical protein